MQDESVYGLVYKPFVRREGLPRRKLLELQ